MIKNILFKIGYFYFLILLKTSKAILVGREQIEQDLATGKRVVFCSPHNFLLPLFAGTIIGKLKRPRVCIVTSQSSDGELVCKLLAKFEFDMIRGSSNRGGKKALMELTRAGKEGKSLGLAFDGPKGPPLVPKRGLIGCARANNGNIYLIFGNVKASRFLPFLKPFRVNSWDKFLVLVPFCRIEVHFEKVPAFIPAQKDFSQKEEEDFILSYIERRSKEEFGHLYFQPK